MTSPAGFRAGAAACGLKGEGLLDVGVLAAEGSCASALVDTTSALPSAAVIHTRSLDRTTLAGVVVNAGCANAATGSPGIGDAAAMGAAGARGAGRAASEIAVCSTGTIGDRLRLDRVEAGIAEATAALGGDGGPAFAEAIRTTDRFAKSGAFVLALPSGSEIVIGAAAKGAGMIRPDMATMLAFVTTDAAVGPAQLAHLTSAAASASFNRISVDGQMSPSDTLLALAGGDGALLGGSDLDRFGAALRAVCRWLAIQMVKDGEGAEHAVRVRTSGAADLAEAERVARAVGESALVRTAIFGRDANWGRVAQAVGAALAGASGEIRDPEVRLDGIPVSDPAAAAVMERSEYDLEVELGRGDAGAELWASDLGYEYVRINAEYRT